MSHLQNILAALQEFEISKARAIECMEALDAGRFDSSMLPRHAGVFALDEIPMDTLQSLKEELATTKARLTESEIAWSPYSQGAEDRLARLAKPSCDGTFSDQIFWLALDNGSVVSGIYEWKQGWDPEGFQTAAMGRVSASNVRFIALYVTPNHPSIQMVGGPQCSTTKAGS